MVEKNIWREVKDFFRKHTDQIIEKDIYLFSEKFLKIKNKTLVEYERVLRKAGYILSLYDEEYYIVKAPPEHLSLRTARVIGERRV